MLKAITRKKVV